MHVLLNEFRALWTSVFSVVQYKCWHKVQIFLFQGSGIYNLVWNIIMQCLWICISWSLIHYVKYLDKNILFMGKTKLCTVFWCLFIIKLIDYRIISCHQDHISSDFPGDPRKLTCLVCTVICLNVYCTNYVNMSDFKYALVRRNCAASCSENMENYGRSNTAVKLLKHCNCQEIVRKNRCFQKSLFMWNIKTLNFMLVSTVDIVP